MFCTQPSNEPTHCLQNVFLSMMVPLLLQSDNYYGMRNIRENKLFTHYIVCGYMEFNPDHEYSQRLENQYSLNYRQWAAAYASVIINRLITAYILFRNRLYVIIKNLKMLGLVCGMPLLMMFGQYTIVSVSGNWALNRKMSYIFKFQGLYSAQFEYGTHRIAGTQYVFCIA